MKLYRFNEPFLSCVDNTLFYLDHATCQANRSVARCFCFALPFLCIGIIVASLYIYGSLPSCQVLLKISSSLFNAGCPRLTIISLVIASGLGDFLYFRFDNALVNSLYNKGELFTVYTSSDSVTFLCSVRTYFCWCSSTGILLACL